MNNSSLKNKALKGVSWSFADNIANSGITFLVGLVLARLLSPSEFGIIGMITIFIAISNSIIDSGFSNALIRKIEIKDIDYNTVFYFNFFISVLLYIILYIASPFISDFFKQPILVPVTRILGVILIINALGIIQRTILIKDVDFKTQTKISFISSIMSGIIGIGMALSGYGVWSLVGQQISRQLLNTLLLWYFSKWRPSLEYSRKSFNEMFGFGSKILVSGLIDTIYKNIYYVVIGRFYNSDQLGQYSRAEQFNIIFSANLTTVIQRVSFPVLSSIQDDSIKLKIAYSKIIKLTMLVTFACMLGLGAVAKPLILFFIGDKWEDSIGYLQIICFSGMLYPLHAINLNVLQVKGRSDLFLKLEIIKKIIGIFPILVGVIYGIKLMLIGSVVTSFIAYFLNSYYSSTLINYSTKKQIMDILPLFGVSLFVAACMWSITFLFLPNLLTLILQCIIGITLAMLIYSRINLEEYEELKQIISNLLKK